MSDGDGFGHCSVDEEAVRVVVVAEEVSGLCRDVRTEQPFYHRGVHDVVRGLLSRRGTLPPLGSAWRHALIYQPPASAGQYVDCCQALAATGTVDLLSRLLGASSELMHNVALKNQGGVGSSGTRLMQTRDCPSLSRPPIGRPSVHRRGEASAMTGSLSLSAASESRRRLVILYTVAMRRISASFASARDYKDYIFCTVFALPNDSFSSPPCPTSPPHPLSPHFLRVPLFSLHFLPHLSSLFAHHLD